MGARAISPAVGMMGGGKTDWSKVDDSRLETISQAGNTIHGRLFATAAQKEIARRKTAATTTAPAPSTGAMGAIAQVGASVASSRVAKPKSILGGSSSIEQAKTTTKPKSLLGGSY
jgi:hypothetical protein